MSTQLQAVQNKPLDPAAIESVLLGGDLSRLSSLQKVAYYNEVCEMVGLNPLTKPFDYLKLNGKEILYANKGCAEQLRNIHKISIRVTDTKTINDVYVVTVVAQDSVGRQDSATGAVNLGGLKGEALANAFMKAETKAKRRVTLSICGLNMLDDTEVDSIKGAERVPQTRAEQLEALGQKEPTGWTFPFGGYKGKSLEQVKRDEGIPELQNVRRLILDAISRNAVYKDSSIDEMMGVVGLIEQYLDSLPDSEFENLGGA